MSGLRCNRASQLSRVYMARGSTRGTLPSRVLASVQRGKEEALSACLPQVVPEGSEWDAPVLMLGCSALQACLTALQL